MISRDDAVELTKFLLGGLFIVLAGACMVVGMYGYVAGWWP